MIGGMTRCMNDFKFCPAEGDMIFRRHNDAVGFDEQIRFLSVGHWCLWMQHVKIVRLEIERADSNPRFTSRECHRNVIFLLKIAMVGTVISMHMRTKNPNWPQSIAFQGALNEISLRTQPRVEQHTGAVTGFIKRNDLPVFQIPGITGSLF